MNLPDESHANAADDGTPQFLDTSPDVDQGEDPEFSDEVEAAVWEWLMVDGGNMTVEERIDQAACLGRYDIVEALEKLGEV
jgi:hypothetical protein